MKHHLFPQQASLKVWFARTPRNINIHDFTMVIRSNTHERIHKGALGGDWNRTWREFADQHPRATQKDCWEQLGKMIKDFGLMGPIVPYYQVR